MPQQASVVSVFLASPGDLVQERDVIAQMISSMNLELSRSGVVIQLRRWESLPPGASSRDPQDVVNRQADIPGVDIFLGLMWRRGGSPTTVAESGTIEEYRIAVAAWREKQSPQIALYFRPFEQTGALTIEEQRQRDVVAAFRKEVSELHLCKTLPDRGHDAMERMLRTDLRQMVDAVIRDVAVNTRSDRVFGKDDGRVGPMLIVSGEFSLHPEVVASIQKNSELDDRRKAHRLASPLFKGGSGARFSYSAASLISIAETRASSYLATAFSQAFPAPRRFKIVSDAHQADNDELDILSLGSYSNDRSLQIAADAANRLVVPGIFRRPDGSFDCRFISKSTGRPIHAEVNLKVHDYGVIMRVAPQAQPERTWLFCGGLSERGTSGSAYFLANRWKEIAAKIPAGCRHFIALLRIEATSDQRGQLLGVFLDPAELPTFDVPEHTETFRWDHLSP